MRTLKELISLKQFLKELINQEIQVKDQLTKSIFKYCPVEVAKTIINKVENASLEPHALCRRLRMLQILINREKRRRQLSFDFLKLSDAELKKHESDKAVVEAAELFLANEHNLPYYFGAQRLCNDYLCS